MWKGSFDDRHLFEMLVLEGAQAGLRWRMILNERDRYRAAFDHFDAEKVAAYAEADAQRLLGAPGIVRNRLKVESAAEQLCPHSSSVIAFTLRVDTPCPYILVNAATNAFSERC